jgi:hypothetical protein
MNVQVANVKFNTLYFSCKNKELCYDIKYIELKEYKYGRTFKSFIKKIEIKLFSSLN